MRLHIYCCHWRQNNWDVIVTISFWLWWILLIDCIYITETLLKWRRTNFKTERNKTFILDSESNRKVSKQYYFLVSANELKFYWGCLEFMAERYRVRRSECSDPGRPRDLGTNLNLPPYITFSPSANLLYDVDARLFWKMSLSWFVFRNLLSLLG